MHILKWAAVAVTALFVLMNLGAVVQPDVHTTYRLLGAVLAIAGIVAAAGLATDQSWGRAAVIGVGSANVLTALTGLFTGQQGAAIGLVVGGLGAVLGALAPRAAEQPTVA